MQMKQENGQLLVRTEYAFVVVGEDFVQVLTDLSEDEIQAGHCVEIYPNQNQVFIDPESDRKQQLGMQMVGEEREYVILKWDDTERTMGVHESNIRRQPPGDPSEN